MHGHGYAPPPQRPTSAQLVVVRVILVSVALFSCGFLAWAPLLRLAIVTRAVRDWVLFAASGLVIIVSVLLIGSESSDDLDTFQENLGLFGLLGGTVATIAYYLVAEIRHFAKQDAPFVPHPAPHTGPPPAYGYPPQPGPAQQVTRPSGMPQPGPQSAAGAPQPQRPTHARIDQVRAELDELSSLLRHQDGPHGPDAVDGRAEGEPR